MNLNKKLIIVLFAVIFASCSTNNNIQVIDSENIQIEELEKNFNRVIGSGVLQGKGKSNFSSSFIFESSGNTPEIDLGAPVYDKELADRRRSQFLTSIHTLKEKMVIFNRYIFKNI